jgi:ferritin
MRLSQELNDVLNEQVVIELRNANSYSQVEAFFKDLGLDHLARYFHLQSKEERHHATEFMKYINKRLGGKVTIGDVPAPGLNLNSIKDVAAAYLSLETATTESIEEIMQMVLDNKSYIDMDFIQEMLEEQVEEEDEAMEFANKIVATQDLLLLDKIYRKK